MKKLQILCSLLMINMGLSAHAQNNNSLEKYFDKNQINIIQDYKTSFSRIKSSKDLADTYRKANNVMKVINDVLNESKEINTSSFDVAKFKWLDTYLPGIELGYGAEGIGVNAVTYYPDFIAKAKVTAEKSDDAFLKLMTDLFGNSGDIYPKWFVMTWDYGGYTMLGKGTHTNYLKKITSTAKISPEFANEIKEVRLRLFDDIQNSLNLGTPKATAIKEVKSIMGVSGLSANEKKMLQQKIIDLDKNSKKYQFNCEKANCSYG